MRFIIICLIIYSFSFLIKAEAKTIYIPEDVTVEENAFHLTKIRNLSEIDIYSSFRIFYIDGYIYIWDSKTPSIKKLSPQGELISQFGSKGQGPGESTLFYRINKFNQNLAILGKYKMIFCNNDLKYLNENRLGHWYQNFIIANDNQFYFFNNLSKENHYFSVYNRDFKLIKKFGKKNKSLINKKNTKQNYKLSSDHVRQALYVAEENVLWISLRNPYHLRCYKNEKVLVDIVTKKPFFKFKEDMFSGVSVKILIDYPILIAKQDNQLYHFYKKDQKLFCDVFNLSENYRLLRRIKFPYKFNITHAYGSVFYGLSKDAESDEVFLYKIQIDQKGKP